MAKKIEKDVFLLEDMTTKGLEKELELAIASKNYSEMGKITAALEKRAHPEKAVTAEKTFDEATKKILGKINKKTPLTDAEKEELKTFFTVDIKNYKSGVKESVKGAEDFKKDKIKDLTQELNDVLKESGNVKEALSPNRMRLANIKSNMEKLKANEKGYPKNVLVYAMAVTKTSRFGINDAIKRMQIRWNRNSKSDDMKKDFANLEKKLEVKEGDSATRKVLKKMIGEYFHDAKTKFVEKTKTSLGL